ncbi:MAG TPA: type II secretion system protein GspC [Gammaproteobacteria bacterium]|nr:type II secretion system protein GspC [Gammaproteobacteria bacterium]
MSSNALRFPGGEAALRRTLAVLEHRLPVLVSTLLLLVTAWLLAQLSWELLPSPKGTASIYSGDNASPAPAFDINTLINQHLFGVSGTQNASNAPETTLDLTLSGIAADSYRHESRAIIVSGGKQQTYGVGAQLPGGAVIKDILPDRVLLSLNGRIESLRLPKLSGGDNSATPAFSTPRPQTTRPPSGPPPANLGQLRHQVMQHPERLLDVVRAMPVMENGKFVGYRVFPAGNPRLFAQMGLKPGDVVTAVNGISLDNPADSMRILSKLKTSDQVSITFTRNGQQQTEVLQMQNTGK